MGDRDLRKLQAEIERLNARLAELEGRPAGRLRGLLARAGSSPRLRLALVAAVVGLAAVSYAAQISIPYTFVNGTPADADEVNANFSTLVNESNAQDSRITTVEGDLTAHQGDSSAHHSKTTDASELTSGVLSNARLAPGVDTNAANDVMIGSTAGGDLAGTFPSPQVVNDSHTHDARYYTESQVNALMSAQDSRITALEGLLAGLSRGGTPDTLTFSGMNVQLVDGSGGTDGPVNGLGNLIVGYNENNYSATRTGSHNLVVGFDHGYASFAGLVAGRQNTITAPYSTVSGGYQNTASAAYASVSGGDHNEASGTRSSVSGGYYNTASAGYSSISGGRSNTASGHATSISGGYDNAASRDYASVSGGESNEAGGWSSSVSGGYQNWAGNLCQGGTNPGTQCQDDGDCTGGGVCLIQSYQSVSGGKYNEAGGTAASVSGGHDNEASNDADSVSGGRYNKASGFASSVSGGENNEASGGISSVSGGDSNEASTLLSSLLGIQRATYSAYATSTTPVSTTTTPREYCALTEIRLQTGDAGTNKYCNLTRNGDDTWTLTARGGASSANVNCEIICY